MVQQYLTHCREILTSRYTGFKQGSKGSGLISLFGYQNFYDLRDGFPLLTTKKMAKNSIIHELIWFLKGETNIRELELKKVPVWRGNAFEYNLEEMMKAGIVPDGIVKYSPDWDNAMKEYAQRIIEDEDFAQRFGDAGPIYGKQWRRWRHFDEKKGQLVEIDQLGDVIEKMKKRPVGKKYVITAWNPGDNPSMSLEPCHVLFQMTSNDNGELDLQMYQRSCDQFLGVPFNIASYSMMTQVFAQELGLTARRFVHTFGDSHFYTGLSKRGQWYKKNLKELQERARRVSDREGYFDLLRWVNENAPRDADYPDEPQEEKYDHVTAILEQLSRFTIHPPTLTIARKPFDKLAFEDFKIEGYDCHPKIERAMAV